MNNAVGGNDTKRLRGSHTCVRVFLLPLSLEATSLSKLPLSLNDLSLETTSLSLSKRPLSLSLETTSLSKRPLSLSLSVSLSLSLETTSLSLSLSLSLNDLSRNDLSLGTSSLERKAFLNSYGTTSRTLETTSAESNRPPLFHLIPIFSDSLRSYVYQTMSEIHLCVWLLYRLQLT